MALVGTGLKIGLLHDCKDQLLVRASVSALQVGEEAAMWRPPGSASITCAVVMPDLVVVASAQPHALTALVLSHPGSPSGR